VLDYYKAFEYSTLFIERASCYTMNILLRYLNFIKWCGTMLCKPLEQNEICCLGPLGDNPHEVSSSKLLDAISLLGLATLTKPTIQLNSRFWVAMGLGLEISLGLSMNLCMRSGPHRRGAWAHGIVHQISTLGYPNLKKKKKKCCH
jgi:hypothetical protein